MSKKKCTLVLLSPESALRLQGSSLSRDFLCRSMVSLSACASYDHCTIIKIKCVIHNNYYYADKGKGVLQQTETSTTA